MTRGVLACARIRLVRLLPDPGDPIVLGLVTMAVGAICVGAGFAVLLR